MFSVTIEKQRTLINVFSEFIIVYYECYNFMYISYTLTLADLTSYYNGCNPKY